MTPSQRLELPKRGALIAEALFGTLLIAVVLTLLASSILYWEKLVKASRDRNGARLVARQEMERCSSLDFEELENCDTAGTPIAVEIVRGIDGMDTRSQYETQIEVRTRPDERIKSLRVLTRYGPEKQYHLELFTLVYQSS